MDNFGLKTLWKFSEQGFRFFKTHHALQLIALLKKSIAKVIWTHTIPCSGSL